MTGPSGRKEDFRRVLDEAIDALRWVRLHPHEPKAAERLREVEARLGYLGLALHWQTDGDPADAELALELAEGRSLQEGKSVRQRWEEMWWSH